MVAARTSHSPTGLLSQVGRLDWAPGWVARAVALVGLLGIIGAALPEAARIDVVPELISGVAPRATRVAAIAAGMLLLVLARGLRRRKRRAWTCAVLLAAAAGTLHLVRDFDLVQAVLTVLLIALLFATRGAFTGMPDPRSAVHIVVVFLGSTAIAGSAGFAAILFDRDGLVGHPGPVAMAKEVLLGLIGLSGPLRFRDAEHADSLAVILALLGGAVVVSTLAAALRPSGGPHGLTRLDEERLRRLLREHGHCDSLGYFCLRREKSVIFSPTGKAAIGYRVVGGVSLAAGDPLGDPEAWPGVIQAWLNEARHYAWTPAVLGPSERGAAAYHRAGLAALELGDEAVISVADFTLLGRSMRSVRQAVGRVRRLGYQVEICDPRRLTHEALAEVQAAAERWREGSQERGFAMALGRIGDSSDEGCVLVRCRSATGELVGLLHLVPWGDDGLSLDLMRRSPATDNGVVELMVVELLTGMHLRPLRRVSLNFAVFRSALEGGARLGAGPVLRLWRQVLLYASRFWQIESLYRASAKYHPEWMPRYLCYRSARDLPQVTVAALQAEAFIAWPSLRLGHAHASRLAGHERSLSLGDNQCSATGISRSQVE